MLRSLALLAALAVPTVAVADCPREDQLQRAVAYRNLVQQYRTGDRPAALSAAARWTDHDYDRALAAIFPPPNCFDIPTWRLDELRSAAFLESDLAQTNLEAQRFDEMKRRFAIARRFLHQQKHDAFTQQWHLVFARRLRVGGLVSPWALEFLRLALTDLPDNPDLLLESGIVSELAAAGAGAVEVTVDRARLPVTELRRRFYRTRLAEGLVWLRRSAAIRESPLTNVHLARLLIASGEPEEATRLLTAVIADQPASRLSYVARLLLGEIDQAAGRYDDALRSYDAARDVVPSAQSARFAASALAFSAGRAEDAAQRLAQLSNTPAEEGDGDDPWSEYLFERRDTVRRAIDELRREAIK